MSKYLYISPFDSTGYGQAALETVLAMKYVGLDVVCRQINLNNKPTLNHPILQELLQKPLDNCDVCIQHVLPTLFDYNGDFARNILFFALETNQLTKLWHKHCNLADSIWVINKHSHQVLKKSLVKPDIHVIPHPVDLNKFTKSFLNNGHVAQLKAKTGAYVFYTIGEFVSRKNYEALLKAYFSEFTIYDNTCLVIKTSKDGASPTDCKNHVMELVNMVKSNLKLTSFAPIEIITDFLSEEDLEKIHVESDVFVQTSHGEAWSLVAMAAIGYGKCPIVPGHTGYLDYVKVSNGFAIKSYETPCYETIDVQPNLYHGRQTWYDIDIMDLRRVMRMVYKNQLGCLTTRKSKSLGTLEHFSYQKVGNIIKRALDATK